MERFSEFRTGWRVLLAAILGTALGVTSLLTYNLGLFVPAMASEFGLNRGQFGFGILVSTIGMALALPLVGVAVDRFGAKPTAAAGGAMLALAFAAIGLLTETIFNFFLLFLLLGILGAPTTPVAFARAVTTWFDRSRGLALALVLSGIGISSVLVPPLTAIVINAEGWRAGFLALAALSFAAVPITLLLLNERKVEQLPPFQPVATDKAEFALIFRMPLFWLQGAAFAIMAAALFGVIVHFAPMLTDQGIGLVDAAGYVSLLGFSTILSRLVIGSLADLLHAPWLAIASCLLGALACVVMATGDPSLYPLAALAVGFAAGGESDLLAYLTARYFGLRNYGQAFAWQYGIFIVTAGLSPAWTGMMHDASGDYTAGLFVSAGLALVAALLFALLPRYPKAGVPVTTAA